MKQKHEWGFSIIENMCRKPEKSKINHLSFHLRNPGKEEQAMSKVQAYEKRKY